jgi:hypothetical protein
MMRTRLNLRPGMRGTKKLVTKYGDRLVCVRYRYDAAQGKRYKTVELIEETADWVPASASGIAPERIVAVQVTYGETELRQQVKAAGGQWNSAQKVWALRYDQVVRLGLAERIVPMESDVEEGGG